jgi:hypothetical protein
VGVNLTFGIYAFYRGAARSEAGAGIQGDTHLAVVDILDRNSKETCVEGSSAWRAPWERALWRSHSSTNISRTKAARGLNDI